MFLSEPPDDPAVSALYDEAVAEDGYVMNLVRVWAWRPDMHAAFLGLRKGLVEETTLSKREIAVLNATTAAQRHDSYCALAWGTRVAQLSDDESAGALLRGELPPGLSSRENALARWARVVVTNPSATTSEDVELLRAARLSDREIVDATLFVAFRLAFTTVNGALGARPDRQLSDEAPPSVRDSVTFGRAVDGASSSIR